MNNKNNYNLIEYNNFKNQILNTKKNVKNNDLLKIIETIPKDISYNTDICFIYTNTLFNISKIQKELILEKRNYRRKSNCYNRFFIFFISSSFSGLICLSTIYITEIFVKPAKLVLSRIISSPAYLFDFFVNSSSYILDYIFQTKYSFLSISNTGNYLNEQISLSLVNTGIIVPSIVVGIISFIFFYSIFSLIYFFSNIREIQVGLTNIKIKLKK